MRANSFLAKLFRKTKTDIDDRSNNKHLLLRHASLARYHSDLIVVLSPKGKIVSQNHGSINEFLGCSPASAIRYKDFLRKTDYHKLRKAFVNALRGQTARHDSPITHKDGSTIHVTLTFIPNWTKDKDVQGVYIIVRDNTRHRRIMDELELYKSHMEHVQQIAQVGSWEYLIREDHLRCSDYLHDIYGIKRTEGQLPMDMLVQQVHPDDYQKLKTTITKAIQKGISYVIDFRIFHGNTNELRYLKAQAETIWKSGKPYKLIGVVQDNTTQYKLENQMEQAKAQSRMLIDELTVGIWLMEYATGKLEYISKGAEELLQYPLQNLYDELGIWEKLLHPDDKQEVINRQQRLAKGEPIRHQYRIQCGDGTLKWVYDQTIPQFDDSGQLTHLFGMMADITPEMEMRYKLDYLASHDALTALPNQRSLYEKLDTLCSATQSDDSPFALFYLDLDRFQLINDSLGYTIGDTVLKTISTRLIAVLPDDSYLARISSNDFVLIIENYQSKNAVFRLAEQVIETIEEPVTVDGYELHVTTSIGIGFYPEDGDDKLSLLESAHAALHRAKQLGKNNYQLYSVSKDITSYKKFALEKDMRAAIEREEFEVYFQPQVRTSTGTIQGAEALIRWNHTDWGLVSPGEFIPLAEENHLIHEIGDWVIAHVCQQLRKWKDAGYTLRPIAINVSPIRLMKKGLVDFVEAQLTRYSIPAKYLELEITESSLLKNEKVVLNTLEGLRNLGISIAIDDFGTGHSSLTYVQQFTADTIKIDKSFIQSIAAEHNSGTAITSSILHLARGLDMKVVAEGVEEHVQLEFLTQHECDEIQGYLFSKPVSLATFEQMLETGYLKPNKTKLTRAPEEERRNYFRLEFPSPLLGEMTIREINERKVNLGSANILIEDIGLGGLKILTALKLPINSSMKLQFNVTLMGEQFELCGELAWKNEAKGDTFYYGVEFSITEAEKDRLAGIINKMSVLVRLNHDIPETNFIEGSPYAYINKHHL
ncbi:EAL domain-containing protein [Lentibacillus lipolyticus]|nr:EAL domain-containing protein [Lentibacillus lipolyticus]